MDIKKYLTEVKSEMNKVSWPSRRKTLKDSALVVLASLMTALFIGGIDALFSMLTGQIIAK